MRILILSVLLAIVASSCGTSKLKQQVKAHNYFNKYPNELAELCGSKFPPVTKYIPGKPVILPGDTVITTDTVKITVDCPDGTKKDCPPGKIKTIRDTVKITDTLEVANHAALVDLNYKLAKAQAENEVLAQKNTEQAKTIKKRNWQIGGLITFGVIAILVRLFFYLKLRK